jgi:hypothetical protein
MSDQKKPIKLTIEDWDSLLPGKEVTLGKTSFFIYPLGLKALSNVMKSLKNIFTEISGQAITLGNFIEPSNFAIVTSLILEKAPGVIAETTGLDIEDVSNLPLTPAIKLLEEIIDVNIESQDDLIKNLKSLTGKMGKMSQTTGV